MVTRPANHVLAVPVTILMIRPLMVLNPVSVLRTLGVGMVPDEAHPVKCLHKSRHAVVAADWRESFALQEFG